jgi:regulator of protease activity HflC (stomatin/prohibitin superfamily)
MTPALIIELALFAFVALAIARSVVVVPAGSVHVVERVGRDAKTLLPGVNILFPFVEKVRARYVVSDRKQDFEQPAITRDHQVMRVKGVIRYEIVDPVRATYGVDDVVGASAALAGTVRPRAVDQARAELGGILAEVAADFAVDAEPWGLRTLGCDLELVR